MIRVIINADDCGYSPEVNSAIDYALSKGSISSTTILANSKYLDEVHSMVERHPNASFGIHLNLTEGESLTRSEVLFKYKVIDANGLFDISNQKRCSNPTNELKDAIRKEWDAQFKLLLKEGFKLSHVDGHHHCHAWPGMEDILVGLMLKYGLTKARNKFNYPVIPFKEKIKKAIKIVLFPFRPYSSLVRNLTITLYNYKNYNLALNNAHVKTTDFFCSYDEYSKIQLKGNLKDYTIELMCHPGSSTYKDEEQAILEDIICLRGEWGNLISFKQL